MTFLTSSGHAAYYIDLFHSFILYFNEVINKSPLCLKSHFSFAAGSEDSLEKFFHLLKAKLKSHK